MDPEGAKVATEFMLQFFTLPPTLCAWLIRTPVCVCGSEVSSFCALGGGGSVLCIRIRIYMYVYIRNPPPPPPPILPPSPDNYTVGITEIRFRHLFFFYSSEKLMVVLNALFWWRYGGGGEEGWKKDYRGGGGEDGR